MMSPAVWAAATVPPQPRCTVAVLPVEDHTSIVSRPMVMVAPATMEPRPRSTTTLVTDVFMVVVRRLTSGRLPESSRERVASTRSEASVAIAHLQVVGLGRLRAEPLATSMAVGMGRALQFGQLAGVQPGVVALHAALVEDARLPQDPLDVGHLVGGHAGGEAVGLAGDLAVPRPVDH